MNRFERLAAILLLLHTRRVIRGQDIADRFGISVRTVYRDLRALEAAGLPLCGEPGIGYSLVDGYRLSPVAFTDDEAMALLAAEKLAASLTGPETARHITSAMDKVRSVLRPVGRDRMEVTDALIEVLGPRGVRPLPPATPATYEKALAAVSTRRVLRLRYRTGHGGVALERDVEPFGLYLESHWCVVAFCRLREEVRAFRLDRIEAVEVLDETYAPRAETLQRYLSAQAERRSRLHPARVRFNPDADRQALSAKHHYEWISEVTTTDGQTDMTFLPTTLEYLAAWLLPQAASISDVSPPELQAHLRDLAAQAQARFSCSASGEP